MIKRLKIYDSGLDSQRTSLKGKYAVTLLGCLPAQSGGRLGKALIKAFSTIELLLALAIFGIMLAVTVHFGKGLFEKNRALAVTDEVRVALRFTRTMAIKLGEKVKFCSSKSRTRCDGSWQDGQIVVTDSGVVQRVLPKIFAGDRLVYRSSFGERDAIVFLPTGFSHGQKGHFYYCPGNNRKNALAVILESTGRVRVANKTSDGNEISCDL